MFPKMGYPQIIDFNCCFHMFSSHSASSYWVPAKWLSTRSILIVLKELLKLRRMAGDVRSDSPSSRLGRSGTVLHADIWNANLMAEKKGIPQVLSKLIEKYHGLLWMKNGKIIWTSIQMVISNYPSVMEMLANQYHGCHRGSPQV